MKSCLLWFAFAATLSAQDADPAAAALGFARKVKEGRVDLDAGKDTAISRSTAKDKREFIFETVTRLKSAIPGGALQAGPVQVDGDLAAVLIHPEESYDPRRQQVLAVALVRREGVWRPAPLPGSFENTGLGYDEAVIRRREALEAWMTRERTTELAGLKSRADETLRKAMSAKVPPAELKDGKPEELVKRFCRAASERDIPAVLALSGGLGRDRPEDWDTLVPEVCEAFAADTLPPGFRSFTPGSLQVVIESTLLDSDPRITLACLTPKGGVQASEDEILRFDLKRDDEGLWRIIPPRQLFAAKADPVDPRDGGMFKLMPAALRRDIPAAKHADARALVDAWTAALAAASVRDLISLIDLEGNPQAAWHGCTRIAGIWGDLHVPRNVRQPLLLAFHEEGDGAIAAYQFFSANDPEEPDIRLFHFFRGPDGWLAPAGLDPEHPPRPSLAAMSEWAAGQHDGWKQNWKRMLLEPVTVLGQLPAGSPSADEAKAVFERWREAVGRGDVQGALALTARLDREDSIVRLLRNLGHELADARRSGDPLTVLGIHRKGRWTAVSARTGPPGGEASYPLYPLVSTPSGARVLTEVDLFAETSRARSFLNNSTWAHLRNDPDAEKDLRELFELHNKAATADQSSPSP